MASVRLGDHVSPDLEGRSRTLLLPLGATEQHGPHLPLDTDTVIAEAIAFGVAAVSDDAVVAPAIAIGASGEHQGFAGTLSIGTRVLSEVMVEIVRTAGAEFDRVVVINGHGGNAYALRAAAAVCMQEGRAFDVWSVRLPGADAHAGRTETSLMLHLDPDRVRLDRAVVGNTAPLADLLPEMMDGGLQAVSPNGVLGDPAGADAAEGAELLATLVADAVAQISGTQIADAAFDV